MSLVSNHSDLYLSESCLVECHDHCADPDCECPCHPEQMAGQDQACPEPLCPACGEAPCEPLAGLCGACERQDVLAHDEWQDAVAAEHYALIEAGLIDATNDFDPFQ
jgi:hypothetical protein